MHKTLTEQVLRCASWHEAQDVIDALFDKGLILRAEILPIKSDAEQVMVVLENLEDEIKSINLLLRDFFGHDSFTLQRIPR